MRVSDYIVDFLVNVGVTDVFGLPGGVVLDFLYAVDRRESEISAHLNFHEQGAAFAACGYAQAMGKLGVAYSTLGPGITNMITSVIDAYRDSIPVLFITAQSYTNKHANMRFESKQELDLVHLMSNATKYIARVERSYDVRIELERAYHLATTGRKGPVLLDFSTRIFSEEVSVDDLRRYSPPQYEYSSTSQVVDFIVEAISKAKRPVLLIGDGLRNPKTATILGQVAVRNHLPVLSSRFSQDVIPDCELYYGSIGSHATRYSNFVLSKADLLVSLGNRMAFNPKSQSFGAIVQNAKIIRVDIDESEFERDIPGSVNWAADVDELLPQLALMELRYNGSDEWVAVCNELKSSLHGCDVDFPVTAIADVIKAVGNDAVIVSDVGNNEMWLGRAYTWSGVRNRVLYSKSFGTLGCGLPKAIGAYFSTRKRVLCFAGDQGLQMSIQELQFIASHNLPILLVILNNASSGMIRSVEKRRFGSHFMLTTADSGYSVPDFAAIIKAYRLDYRCFTEANISELADIAASVALPCVIELKIDDSIDVNPYLPVGNPCQDFEPPLDRALYDRLNDL